MRRVHHIQEILVVSKGNSSLKVSIESYSAKTASVSLVSTLVFVLEVLDLSQKPSLDLPIYIWNHKDLYATISTALHNPQTTFYIEI
jgi:hypothetical protein